MKIGLFSIARSMKDQLAGNAIAKAITVLVAGAASAHAITALALPILSRLYTPQDFSVLAVFNSIMVVITVSACLRYDVAVPLPERDDDAFTLFALAIGIAGSVSILLMIPVFLFSKEIADLVDQPVMAEFLWLLPPGVFLSASASAFQNWFIRQKGFSAIATSRIMQSSGAVALQFGAAALQAGPIGLLLGAIFNTGGAVIVLGRTIWSQASHLSQQLSWRELRRKAHSYRDFPLYSATEALFNMASLQVPIILISALALGPEPGYLLLAISVLQAPMALLGIAIGQIYLSHASEEHRLGQLADFTINTTATLIRSGVGPLIACGIAAPFLFGPVFGDGWERAGVIVAWMTPWFIMQFLASPISMALIVIGQQRRGLVLQIFSLVCRVGSVYLAWSIDVRYITEAYAISGFVSYFVYYCVVFIAIGAPVSTAFRQLISNTKTIFCWTALGLASILLYTIISTF